MAYDDLLPASFFGEKFFMVSHSKEGGRKAVVHEYPNSDRRYVEDMGRMPQTFNLEGIVCEPDSKAKRENLEWALNQSGLNYLVHPVYGRLLVKPVSYSVTSSQSELGVYKFSMQFMESEDYISLEDISTITTSVSNAAEQAREDLNSAFGEIYEEPTFAQNILSIASKVNGVINSAFDKARSAVGVVTSTVSAASQFVTNINAQVNQIVLVAADLQSTITDLYENILALANTPDILIDVWNDLIAYGTSFFEDTENEQLPSASTYVRTQRLAALNQMNEHTRLMALINLYEAVAYKDFDTDVELNEYRENLDESYKSMVLNQENVSDGVTSLMQDQDLMSSMNQLRITANSLYDVKEQNTWRIVTIDAANSSSLLLSYRYYGDIDNVDLITDLNKNINCSNMTGTINLITE